MKRVRFISFMILLLILSVMVWVQDSWAESIFSNLQNTAETISATGGKAGSANFILLMSSGGQGTPIGPQSSENYSEWGGWIYTAQMNYTRGDVNVDGVINIGDAIYLLYYLFKDSPPPDPMWVGDSNCDDEVNLGDAIFILNYLFKGGPPSPC